MPNRWADLHMEQLPNGYWLGRITIKIPQLPQPHVQENGSFHNVLEVMDWAIGVVDLLTRNV